MQQKIVLAALAAGLMWTGADAQAGTVRAMDAREANIGRATTDSSATTSQRRAPSSFSGGGRAAAAGTSPYLPGAKENFDLVGKLDVPGVFPGQIADVAVHKGFAYLMSWDDPGCQKGGYYTVDVRDPANPKLGPFVPALQPYYHGEGAHAVEISTPQFKGDLLAVNNETYSGACGGPDKTGGGFDLYDVSDPLHPKALVQAAGDKAPDGALEPQNQPKPNSYHSVFVWQDGPRAYLVGVDNTELADVDIWDITDPTAPEQIGDYDLVALFPEIVSQAANGDQIFHHDAVVKRIGGKQVLLANYWDAGYVQLDVTDPAKPTLITDTDFDAADPLTGFSTPEGNAHQGEFSANDEFLLAADEDFTPFRSNLRPTDGPQAGRDVTVAEGDATPISSLEDGKLNGPSTFVGNGCDPATVPAAPVDDPATDDLALIQRGGTLPDGVTSCGFAHKFANAAAKGWDGVVIFNQVRPDDTLVNMSTGPGTIPGVIMKRSDALGDQGVLAQGAATPAIGTAGPTLDISQAFDGWGYAHLYDAKTSEELDAYAIPEALDERYATGFGDLSIHEFATDPTANVAYAAYYAGGMRAFTFSRADGLVPTAKYIEDDGSNYWGVEQFTTGSGQRLIAGSDRDKGLRILRYTGPGAPQPPAAPPAPTSGGAPVGGTSAGTPPAATPAAVPPLPALAPLTVKLGSGFSMTRRRLLVSVAAPSIGTLSTELRARIGGRTVRLGRTTRNVLRAGTYRLAVKVSAANTRSLRRAVRRSRSKKVTGTVVTSFRDLAGRSTRSTRTLGLK